MPHLLNSPLQVREAVGLLFDPRDLLGSLLLPRTIFDMYTTRDSDVC